MNYEDQMNVLYNFSMLMLRNKPHIKKYNKLRKLHSEIIDNMLDYIQVGKYDINKKLKEVSSDKFGELKDVQMVNLDLDDPDDITIFTDLLVYNNVPKLKSVTDEYIEKNRFRNKEKVEMLNAMKNSYVSLFKVVKTDENNAYVYYEDVFTKKIYKVIDISLSISYKVSSKGPFIYIFNRIIPIDKDTYFGTGIHCMLTSENKEFMKYVNKCKKEKTNKVSMCLGLYKLSKKERTFKIVYRSKY